MQLGPAVPEEEVGGTRGRLGYGAIDAGYAGLLTGDMVRQKEGQVGKELGAGSLCS
jgi:hypothetical protein